MRETPAKYAFRLTDSSAVTTIETFMRPLVMILLLTGIALHTLPLRQCVISAAVGGGNCHTISGIDSTCSFQSPMVDGHAGMPGESHNSACRCEIPKAGVNRYHAAAVDFDFALTFDAPLDLGEFVCAPEFAPHIGPPPDRPVSAINLPLLT